MGTPMTRGLFLLSLTFASACISSVLAQDEPESLQFFLDQEDTFWTLDPLPDGTGDPEAIIYFRADTMNIVGSCYRQGWSIGWANGVELLPLRRTSNASTCEEARAVVATLGGLIMQARVFHTDADTMSFLDEQGSTLFTLSRLRSDGLENRKWYISSVFDGQSLVESRRVFPEPEVQRQRPSVVFVHGSLDGTPGCGAWSGTYVLEQSTLSVEGGWNLMGPCFAGHIVNDAVDGLIGERTLEEDGDSIPMHDESGQVRLVLLPWELRDQ